MNAVYLSHFYIHFNCCDSFVGRVTVEPVGSRAREVQSTSFLEGSEEPPHQVRTGIYEAFFLYWGAQSRSTS